MQDKAVRNVVQVEWFKFIFIIQQKFLFRLGTRIDSLFHFYKVLKPKLQLNDSSIKNSYPLPLCPFTN